MSDNDLTKNTSGGRSLGGGDAEPLPESWTRPQQASRLGRIGDWPGGGQSSRGAPRFGSIGGIPGGAGSATGDDSDGDDDDGDKREQWFAGGERSGLSIENPDRPSDIPGGDMVRSLLRRAAEAGVLPVADRPNAFSGGGHRLGGEEVESAYVPDPNAEDDDEPPVVRRITLWRDGFTVEDGQLFRYDDPNNAETIAQLKAGHAPFSILNIRAGQRVDLSISKRTDENYVPPPGAKVFSGTGNRLGAPVPSISGAGSASGSNHMPGSFPSAAPAPAVERDNVTTHFEVDQALPTTSVQIRLADGTRIVCRMNLTHKVRDLRNFIDAARPENRTRPYTIGTTFPNRTLEDLDATIEGAGLVNSVVVQRWS